jgi:hypothetical protein
MKNQTTTAETAAAIIATMAQCYRDELAKLYAAANGDAAAVIDRAADCNRPWAYMVQRATLDRAERAAIITAMVATGVDHEAAAVEAAAEEARRLEFERRAEARAAERAAAASARAADDARITACLAALHAAGWRGTETLCDEAASRRAEATVEAAGFTRAEIHRATMQVADPTDVFGRGYSKQDGPQPTPPPGRQPGAKTTRRTTMILYRVENADDLTNEETVGEEIRILHRTADGAQDAIDGMDWDEEWGEAPALEVVVVDDYDSEADAVAAGYRVRD